MCTRSAGEMERASRSEGHEGHRLEKAEEAMEGLKSALASGIGALLSSKTFPPSPAISSSNQSISFPALLF